jgi:hypothetical protein
MIRTGLCALAIAAGFAAPAMAQSDPSESAMVNLIRLLVAQGTITQENADALMKQALSEAAEAKGAVPIATAPTNPDATATDATAPAPTAMASMPAVAAGSQRVTFVPEVVKAQLRDEIRKEVLAEVKDQRWALPEAFPAWINRLEWSGDLRLRSQPQLYADSNTDEFLDFARFNANGPTDINIGTSPGVLPFMNTRENRLDNTSLRLRLGVKAKVNDMVTVGVRLASGGSDSPVSTSETLGGGLVKKDLWLDQAYVAIRPTTWATGLLGRMGNPFSSTDLLYDSDLNFDGVALKFAGLAGNNDIWLNLRSTIGAFPLEYTSSDYPNKSTFKAESETKWLLGAQVGASWKSDPVSLRADLAYYDFQNVQGQLSKPCALTAGNTDCSTDNSRPAFMQKGNTLFLVRDIIPDPANPLNFAQPQYAGLAFDYRVVDLIAGIDWAVGDGMVVSAEAQYLKNIAYDPDEVCRNAPFGLPINNLQPSALGNVNPCSAAAGDTKAKLTTGDTGWMVRGSFGHAQTRLRGQWNVAAGYKYLESDAVVDGYTDSEFHLGGTNAQGYFLSGSYALYDNTVVQVRWLSANEVSGPPLQIDVAQFDLLIGF